jgi:hypothetical protein
MAVLFSLWYAYHWWHAERRLLVGEVMWEISFVSSDERGEESRYKLPEPGSPEGGLGPTVLHVFVFLGSIIICRLYKLTLSHQAQVLCNWECFRFSIKIFSRPALPRGARKKKCYQGPNPLSVALLFVSQSSFKDVKRRIKVVQVYLSKNYLQCVYESNTFLFEYILNVTDDGPL